MPLPSELDRQATTVKRASTRCGFLAGVLWAAALPARLSGQDVQPRVYTPAPVGSTVVSLAYSFSDGPVLFDKTIPIVDPTGRIHSLALSYSRSLGILGRSARFDVVLPYAWGRWTGSVEDGDTARITDGFGDPVARLVIALFGAPALEPAAFMSFQPSTVVGLTLRAGAPLGQYDPGALINIGANRWWVGPQLGVSHVRGSMLFEAYAGARFFQDNSDFFGGETLSQEPLYTFQLHAIYQFRPGLWLAASTRQSLGGATEVGGGDRNAPEANNRVGATLSLPLVGRFGLRVAATTGVTTTVGNNYDSYVVAISALF